MATYTMSTGDIAVHNKVTVANTADTVNFPAGVDCDQIEVISDGAADLYVRVDGTAPASPYPVAWRLPAGGTSKRVIVVPTAGATVVKLISPGVVTYSVTGPI